MLCEVAEANDIDRFCAPALHARLHKSKTYLGLVTGNAVDGEPSLHIVHKTEVLSGHLGGNSI